MSRKLIDLSGNIYGDLTVIKRDGSASPGVPLWLCLCSCGQYIHKKTGELKGQYEKSCGCKKKAHNFVDMTGQKYGQLTIVGRVDCACRKIPKWRLLCSCGKEITMIGSDIRRRKPQDCGCKTLRGHFQDLTGVIFDGFVVIGRAEVKTTYRVMWSCLCSCGKIFISPQNNIKHGHVHSCGCLKDVNVFKMVGKVYGLLTVTERCGSNKVGDAMWKCACQCGGFIFASGKSIRQNNTTSCGCIRSRGENTMSDILSSNNIIFQREKKFISCVDKGYLRFDFFLPDFGMCIEFDGIQHYSCTGWYDEEKLQDIQRRDVIKTKYCEENDIVLLRIPYTEINNIGSILTDWGIILAADNATSTAA